MYLHIGQVSLSNMQIQQRNKVHFLLEVNFFLFILKALTLINAYEN